MFILSYLKTQSDDSFPKAQMLTVWKLYVWNDFWETFKYPKLRFLIRHKVSQNLAPVATNTVYVAHLLRSRYYVWVRDFGEPILVPKLSNHLFYIALVGTRKGLPTLVPKLVWLKYIFWKTQRHDSSSWGLSSNFADCTWAHTVLHSDNHNLCRISRLKIHLRFQSFRLRIFSSKFQQNDRNLNSVLRGLVLQINIPILTLLMHHKLCISLWLL